ncbi:hypothetical protein [Rhodococcus koreensis]
MPFPEPSTGPFAVPLPDHVGAVAVPTPDELVPGVPGAIAVPVPGPDGPPGTGSAVNQVLVTGEAAEPLSGHRAVTRRPDGLFEYASNTRSEHLHTPIWVTTGAAAVGAHVTAVAFGELLEPTWAWVPGPVYLGADGALTQTAPEAPAVFLAQIGSATDPDRIFVDRSPSINLI